MSSAGKLDLDPTAYRNGPDKVAAHHEMKSVSFLVLVLLFAVVKFTFGVDW